MSINSQVRGCRTSAIQLATKCPFACQKIYRDKVAGSKNSLALFGTVIHNILEEYGEYCLKYKYDTDYEFFDSIKGKHTALLPEAMQEEGLELADRLKDRVNFKTENSCEIAEIEKRFYLDENLEVTDDRENYYFTSGIDRFYIDDDVAYVFDYKTSRQIFSPSIVEANLQKDFYSLLVFIAYPQVREVHFSFEFVRYGYTTKPVVFDRDRDLERLKNKLRNGCDQYYELINEDEDAEARPSGFCGLCEVHGLCPAIKNALADECVIADKSDAIKAARQLKAAKIFIKELEDALKQYVDANGNVPISATEQYGIKTEEKSEIADKQKLISALKGQGVPMGAILDIISIPKGKAEKLVKKSAPSLKFDDYLSKRSATKFMYQDLEYGHDSESSQEDG